MGKLEAKYRGAYAGFIWGTLYALLLAYIFSLGSRTNIDYFRFVSLAMLITTPISVGAITIFFCTKEQLENKSYRNTYPWLPALAWSAISILFAWETIICIVMILPLYIPLAYVGGWIGGFIRRKYDEKTNRSVLSSFVLLPLIIMPIETPINTPTIRHSITNIIEINSPVEQVWNSLPNIENITSDELPWNFSHFMGLPKPKAAITKTLEINGIRDLYWEKGVHFQEKITEIKKNKLIAYEVLVDQESMKIAELDTHIVVGDKYFDVESGYYSLTEQNGETILSLTTSYRMTTKVNWYGKLWADFVLDDFHNSVLYLIKNRNEKLIKTDYPVSQ